MTQQEARTQRNCSSCGKFYVPKHPSDDTCSIECAIDSRAERKTPNG